MKNEVQIMLPFEKNLKSKTRNLKCLALEAVLLALCVPAEAQVTGKIPRIGYLKRDAGPRNPDKAFQQGLRDLGWIEGQNIAFEYRWAAFKMDRLPALANELVDLKVDLIVTATQRVTRAAKNATSTY